MPPVDKVVPENPESSPAGTDKLVVPSPLERSAMREGSSIITGMDQVPELFRINGPLEQRTYLVKGELREWSGASDDVFSPIAIDDGNGPKLVRLGSCPSLGEAEAMEALQGAVSAYDRGLGVWPMMSAEERIACVEKFLDLMVERRTEVVKLLMWEIGKTLADSEKEFDRTVQYVRDSITELRKIEQESGQIAELGSLFATTSRTPKGVVLCVGPFNYPLNETFTTLMPALLMGNTVVMKPAKYGVLLLEPLMEAFRDAFPPGVVNAIYGNGQTILTPLMKSGQVDSLAFIGSSNIGNILVDHHPAPVRFHAVLGLGAKNPAIVLADANLENAVKEGVTGALSFNGQRCTALKVFFVHESIADQFAEKLGEAVSKLKCGLPWQEGVKITPLCERGKVEAMNAYVEDAVAHGALVVNPGGGESSGTLFRPAVLYPVSLAAKIASAEQFGPVVPVIPFRHIEEVMNYMHDSPFGQQVSIFSESAGERMQLVRQMRNLLGRGNVNLQCQRGPDTLAFVGRKDSGREPLSIKDALLEFSVPFVISSANRDDLA